MSTTVIARASHSSFAGAVSAVWADAAPARPFVTFTDDRYAGIEAHHTVTVAGRTLADALAIVVAIQADHLARGWTDIFYAWLIHNATGAIIEGRGWNRSQGSENTWDPDGAGTLPSGYLLPVAFIGDYRRSNPSPAALAALDEIRRVMTVRNAAAGARPYRLHRDRASTVCPGPNITADILNQDRSTTTMPADAIPDYAAEAYTWAQANKIISGTADPSSNIDEARMVTMLHRAHKAGGLSTAALLEQLEGAPIRISSTATIG